MKQARKVVYVTDAEMLVIGEKKTLCEQLVPFCTALWPKLNACWGIEEVCFETAEIYIAV